MDHHNIKDTDIPGWSTYQAGRAEKTGVFILKKRKPRVCIPVYKYPTGMDERGPLLYSDRHSARQQVLARKWEIHNSVGSRKNIYT